jgi:hypothetical protein
VINRETKRHRRFGLPTSILMLRRRRLGTVVVATVLLAACGSSSDETRSLDAPAPTADSTTPAPSAPTTSLDADLPTSPEPEPPAAAPSTGGTGQPAPEAPSSSTPASAPAPEPEPSMAWPDDGCSLDNSPGTAIAADGPAPAVELRPESAASPLPDLAVRRVNCAGGWVNLRNEIPAAQPLLVWFWAPH